MHSIVAATLAKKKQQKKEHLLADDLDIFKPINEIHPDSNLLVPGTGPLPTKQHQDTTQELKIQEVEKTQFKIRRVVDHAMINICTCCHWDKIKQFRKDRQLCSYLLLYTILTFILAVIGGVIFNKCEYDHEHFQINAKLKLYEKIKSELPESSYNELDELLNMCGVPMVHDDNRWRLKTATFFAFTTASTIGYGYTTPQTFWGRFSTFLYGLPAICVFGLAMVQIGSAVAYTVDKQIKHRQESQVSFGITNSDWYKRCFPGISIELRRTVLVFGLLLIMIVISGGIFTVVQKNWTYTDGLYFMWISISTIGYGDLRPNVIETRLWANAMLWVGLAMTALVIGAAQDYFQKKIQKWRQEDVDQQDNIFNANGNDNYRVLSTSIQ